MALSSSLLTGPASDASPRLVGQVDEEHVKAGIVVCVAVHVGVLNLHETMHPPLLPWVGVEDHLENIRFSRSTLREIPLAEQIHILIGNVSNRSLTEVQLMQHQTCRSKRISDVLKYESVGRWRPAGWRRSIATRAFRWTLHSARGGVERHCSIFGAGLFPASIQLSPPVLEKRLRNTYTPQLHARAILSPGTFRRVNANFRLVPAQRFR